MSIRDSNVTVSELMHENGKEDTILGIGETLFIPPPSDDIRE